MKPVLAVAFIAVVMAVPALAADPGFLKPSELYDPAHSRPPPPAAGSPKAAEELAEVKKMMAEATPEQRAQAASDNDNENGTIFAAAIGPGWDLAKPPA